MRRAMFLLLLCAGLVGFVYAQNIFQQLDVVGAWTGTKTGHSLVETERHGTTDLVNVLQSAPGAAGIYYVVSPTNGVGNVIFWLYDSAVDVSETSAGNPQWGPKWGVRNVAGNTLFACVCRAAAVANGAGYESGSSVSQWSYNWLGQRPGTFTAGWYKWEFQVTLASVVIKAYAVPGNINTTYTSADGVVGGAVGSGANAVFIQGDSNGGPETFKFDDPTGTGVFANVAGSTPVTPYSQSTWGNIKALYR